MPEIADYAALLLLVSAGLALAALSTQLTARTGIPAAGFLLVAGAVASDLSPGLETAMSVQTVERIAVVALILILFDGGMDIGWRRFRTYSKPILSLGILGTFLTAGVLACVAHWGLGFGWITASLLAAALAPTDPAVTFSVLRTSGPPGPSRTTLEGEAGVNDPAGIALMLGVIELATHADANAWVVVHEFVRSMAIGGAVGLLAGRALVVLMRRLQLHDVGLYPILFLAAAGVVYGVTSLADGSGFLAVFLAGLWMGDAEATRKVGIKQFHAAISSMAEVVVFLALGLSIEIAALNGRVWLDGLVLALALAVLARPLAVAATVPPVGLSTREKMFLSWSGLKGAVPILLAAFAVLAGVQDAERVYGIVFVVVLVSVTVQGSLVATVGRKLKALG